MEPFKRVGIYCLFAIASFAGCAAEDELSNELEDNPTSKPTGQVRVLFPPANSDVGDGDARLMELSIRAPLGISSVSVGEVALAQDAENPEMWSTTMSFAPGESTLDIYLDGELDSSGVTFYNTANNHHHTESGFGLTTKDIVLLEDKNTLLYTREDGLFQFDLSQSQSEQLAQFSCNECDMAVDSERSLVYVLDSVDFSFLTQSDLTEQTSTLFIYSLTDGSLSQTPVVNDQGRPLLTSMSLKVIGGQLYSTHLLSYQDSENVVFKIDPITGTYIPAPLTGVDDGAAGFQLGYHAADIMYIDELNIGFLFNAKTEHLYSWRFDDDGGMTPTGFFATERMIYRDFLHVSRIYYDSNTNYLYVTHSNGSALSVFDVSQAISQVLANHDQFERVYGYLMGEEVMSSLWRTGIDATEVPDHDDRGSVVAAAALDVESGVGYMVLEGRLMAINLKTGVRVLVAH